METPHTRVTRIRRTFRFIGLTIVCLGFLLLSAQAPSANEAADPGGLTFWGVLIGGCLMIIGSLITRLYWKDHPRSKNPKR
jgi:ABC-type antimicrobial peptide transport system permease subunit